MSRLIIKPKDVEIILNCSPGHARKTIRVIKKRNNKLKEQKVTIKEFCRFEGLEVNEVKDELNEFYNRK
uniref:hypothetical protein n=1 Tax=Flavobacterium sp. TaxID=239 RepID=UPI0040493F7A